MSTTTRGKAIFEELVEYPLPSKAGVKDYVFYFVANDGYGKGARKFFNKFYPNHVARNVQSLEDLMAFLSGEIKARRVDQIREIVIVSHGTPQGLIAPVLTTIGPTTKVFKYLTAFSLACLQKDFAEGLFPTFSANRREVIAHMSDKSWVTLRCCNFGHTREGMYALFSFFGGKANVYGPKAYQFFGWHPVMEGISLDIEERNGKVVTELRHNRRRLDSKLAVHRHLVQQRFLPRDVHTPERKDTVVNFYLDKARFSAEFLIAAVKVGDTASPDAVRYDQLVKELNDRKVGAFLKTKFGEQNMLFTKAARVTVRIPGSNWIIRDKLIHEGKTYAIEYNIEERIDRLGTGNSERAVLWGQARIVDLLTANQGLPIQRFFLEGESRLWQGQLFMLTSYAEDPVIDPKLKGKLEALVRMLDKALIKDGATDLIAEFKLVGGINLTAAAKVTVLPPSGTGPRQRKSWIVKDQQSYLIKLEHPVTSTGTQAHALAVYHHFDEKARLLYDCELLQYLGQDPDTPGPELAASLDRYSIDDLTKLIDFLRSPYRPEHSVYIYHAQQAIMRKKEALTWWVEQYGEVAKTQPLFHQPYAELFRSEREDRVSLVYDFNFPEYWREVKVSDPPSQALQQDLFREELLWKRFKWKLEDLDIRNEPDEIQPDSPFNNDDDVRVIETKGLERYVSEPKYILNIPESQPVGCQEFRQIITKWKELQGQDLEQVRIKLDTLKTAGGKSFLETIMHYWDKLQISNFLMGLSLWNIASVKDGFVFNIVSKIPIISQSAGVMGIVSVLPAIQIPLGMWLKVMNEQVRGEATQEQVGRMVAIRQWLRVLETLTFEKEKNFPNVIEIDLTQVGPAVLPYWHSRYLDEQAANFGIAHDIVASPKRMKKGFDEAAVLMQRTGEELIRKVDELIDETLLDSGVFDTCQINVLKELGVVDVPRIRALVLRQLSRQLLDQLPKI